MVSIYYIEDAGIHINYKLNDQIFAESVIFT